MSQWIWEFDDSQMWAVYDNTCARTVSGGNLQGGVGWESDGME